MRLGGEPYEILWMELLKLSLAREGCGVGGGEAGNNQQCRLKMWIFLLGSSIPWEGRSYNTMPAVELCLERNTAHICMLNGLLRLLLPLGEKGCQRQLTARREPCAPEMLNKYLCKIEFGTKKAGFFGFLPSKTVLRSLVRYIPNSE